MLIYLNHENFLKFMFNRWHCVIELFFIVGLVILLFMVWAKINQIIKTAKEIRRETIAQINFATITLK